jgi:CRISPR-associated exonuclease Cas4
VSVPTFGALATAAYCPRQLYYRRRDADPGPPEVAVDRRELAFHYRDLLAADDETLAKTPIEHEPAAYRDRLATTKARREQWAAFCDPSGTEVFLEGKSARGIAHKLVGEPVRPSLVSPGEPPEQGVWKPQRVRAVAAAKALAWERERTVERAYVEYPAHGVIRTVELTTRNKAVYNRVLRTVEAMDGPPARVDDTDKCDTCEYRTECGVRTRSLRSLLG